MDDTTTVLVEVRDRDDAQIFARCGDDVDIYTPHFFTDKIKLNARHKKLKRKQINNPRCALARAD